MFSGNTQAIIHVSSYHQKLPVRSLEKKMWESWLMSVEVFEGEYKKHSVFPVRHVAWIEDN